MAGIIERAREVFDIEIGGLKTLRNNLGEDFITLTERCLAVVGNGGKIVITGIGKSGYIGKKIAATLSSVGSPSVFMHPVEALHGDLGILQQGDLVIALSYSGETEELLGILSPAKRLGIEIIGITGSAHSSLSEYCSLIVEMAVPQEACPFNLAPTATTTALLVLGDALAMVLLQERGFTKENYGRLHPGGAIGRAVTMRIRDIMRTGERLALVSPETTVKDTLLQITSARSGAAIVIDSERHLLGIFTDGDFRRHVEHGIEVLSAEVATVMVSNPIYVFEDSLAVEALKILEKRHINAIIAVDAEKRVTGLVDVQDLPRCKLM